MVAFLGITVMRRPIQERGQSHRDMVIQQLIPPSPKAEMTGNQPSEDVGGTYERCPFCNKEIPTGSVLGHHRGRDVTPPKEHILAGNEIHRFLMAKVQTEFT